MDRKTRWRQDCGRHDEAPCDRFPRARKICLVHMTETHEREHEEGTGMSVSGAQQALPQWIRYASRVSGQRHEERDSAILRHTLPLAAQSKNPGESLSRFASYGASNPRGESRL